MLRQGPLLLAAAIAAGAVPAAAARIAGSARLRCSIRRRLILEDFSPVAFFKMPPSCLLARTA
jgi:hypothetical protein